MPPIARDLIRLTDGEFYASRPYATFEWLRENAPVFWDGEAGVWGLSRYDDIRLVSRTPEVFSNAEGHRPDYGPMPMMINRDDPEHWRRRKLVNRGFTPKRVAAGVDRIQEIVDGLIDEVVARGGGDLVADLAAPLPLILIGESLGFAPEDYRMLLDWSDAMVCSLSSSATEAMVAAAGEAFGEFDAYMRSTIAARKSNPTDDLISVLCHADIDGDVLTDDDILYETLLILIGGDETTRHVISEGVYTMLATGTWSQVAADPAVVPTAVEEMLRWVSPVKNMSRTVTCDYELAGQQLSAGDKVLLLYPAANRDPSVFTNPERFDPTRDPNDHVAFGFGTHFCMGAALARLEISVMIRTLAARTPGLYLVDEALPVLRPANFVSGPESVPIAV